MRALLYDLESAARPEGEKLQIVTDNAIYEASAKGMQQVAHDLRACQGERLKRLAGKWSGSDDDFDQFH